MEHVRPIRLALAALAAFSLLAAPAARADAGAAVQVASKQGIGSYLADSQGRALYVFKKDAPGKSACAGDCLARWPAFYREKVAPAGALRAADFATITRGDGQRQTSYRGLPLYYFAGDRAPGDTSGHGVKDVWLLAKP